MLGAQVAIGIDVGGTKLAGALLDKHGQLLAHRVIPTEAIRGGEHVMQRLLDQVGYLVTTAKAQGLRIVGIGVATPGFIDYGTGAIRFATANLPGWTGMPIRERVKALHTFPVYVENDANAATLGEKLFGLGREVEDMVCVTVGTGIGGGIIHRGALIRGARGGAGGIGHVSIDFKGLPCNCRSFGCVEAYASGPAIVKRAQEALARGEASRLLTTAASNCNDYNTVVDVAEVGFGSRDKLSTEDVVAAARLGDPLARRIVTEAGTYLGYAIATVVNLFNPELVVIAGGVSSAGELLLEPLRETLYRRALPEACVGLRVVQSCHGGDTGVIGAAALVWYEEGETS